MIRQWSETWIECPINGGDWTGIALAESRGAGVTELLASWRQTAAGDCQACLPEVASDPMPVSGRYWLIERTDDQVRKTNVALDAEGGITVLPAS